MYPNDFVTTTHHRPLTAHLLHSSERSNTNTGRSNRVQDAANRTTTVKTCECTAHIESRRLVIDALDCPERGRLSTSAACRATAIAVLDGRPIVGARTRIDGGEYVYDDWAVGLLVAAGRFAALALDHDETLAVRAHRDPLGAAREALSHGGPIAEIAAETGLAEGACRVTYTGAFGDIECELNPLTSARPTEAMLHDIDGAGELEPEELRARYDERLRAVIEEQGVETVADETGIQSIEALADGESPELTLEEAAAILAVREDEPDADAIVLETRDHLLMGMTTAVLDVEAVESGIEGAFDAREIQQKIEGRLPMTLDELAMIHGYIESRKP